MNYSVYMMYFNIECFRLFSCTPYTKQKQKTSDVIVIGAHSKVYVLSDKTLLFLIFRTKNQATCNISTTHYSYLEGIRS